MCKWKTWDYVATAQTPEDWKDSCLSLFLSLLDEKMVCKKNTHIKTKEKKNILITGS
jgi:hypothetical protein